MDQLEVLGGLYRWTVGLRRARFDEGQKSPTNLLTKTFVPNKNLQKTATQAGGWTFRANQAIFPLEQLWRARAP